MGRNKTLLLSGLERNCDFRNFQW